MPTTATIGSIIMVSQSICLSDNSLDLLLRLSEAPTDIRGLKHFAPPQKELTLLPKMTFLSSLNPRCGDSKTLELSHRWPSSWYYSRESHGLLSRSRWHLDGSSRIINHRHITSLFLDQKYQGSSSISFRGSNVLPRPTPQNSSPKRQEKYFPNPSLCFFSSTLPSFSHEFTPQTTLTSAQPTLQLTQSIR